MPRAQELFEQLVGGKRFSKIDLSNAYLQFSLGEESTSLAVISTHKGSLKFFYFPAPKLFRKKIESSLAGLKGDAVLQHDVAITGKNRQEHSFRLKQILRILQESCLKVAKYKHKYFIPTMEYLVYIINNI